MQVHLKMQGTNRDYDQYDAQRERFRSPCMWSVSPADFFGFLDFVTDKFIVVSPVAYLWNSFL